MTTAGLHHGQFVSHGGAPYLIEEVLERSLMVSDDSGGIREIFTWDAVDTSALSDDRVWLTRPMKMQKHFSDEWKTLPAGTCLLLDRTPHKCKHLVYVYGAGCYDSVPIDAISLHPLTATR